MRTGFISHSITVALFVVVISLVDIPSAHAATETVDGILYHYRVNNGKVSIFNDYTAAISTKTAGSLVIPSSLGGYPVTAIGDMAFSSCTGLTSVVLPLGVTRIGEFAFSGCTAMADVSLPTSIMTIVASAFSGCSGLQRLDIPPRITTLQFGTFSGCSGLTELVIPVGTRSIGDGVFEGCSGLTAVTIGNGVTNIGTRAFGGCYSLASIVIPASVVAIGDWAFIDSTALRSVRYLGDAPVTGLEIYGTGASMITNYVLRGSTGWAGTAGDASLPATWQGASVVCPSATLGTPLPVPYDWFEGHGLVGAGASGMAYEAAATKVWANGYEGYASYVAELDPTNGASKLIATITFTDGRPCITYTPTASNRAYAVEGKADLCDDWAATNAASRFFRVRVRMP